MELPADRERTPPHTPSSTSSDERPRVLDHANAGAAVARSQSPGRFRVRCASRACSTRRTLCAPSRPSAGRPSGSRSKAAPQATSSRTSPRAALDQNAHGGFVAQPVAGGQRVLQVQVGRIVVTDRRRDAALRVVRCCPRPSRPWSAPARRPPRPARWPPAGRQSHCPPRERCSARSIETVGRRRRNRLSYLAREAHDRQPCNPRSRRTQYPIIIERGLASGLASHLEVLAPQMRRVIVSSPRVWELLGPRIGPGLPGSETVLIADGERAKQLRSVSTVYDGCSISASIAEPWWWSSAAACSATSSVRGGFVPARPAARAGADHGRGPGGQRHWRQGRGQPPPRQEPDWRLPPAARGAHRPGCCWPPCRRANCAPASRRW